MIKGAKCCINTYFIYSVIPYISHKYKKNNIKFVMQRIMIKQLDTSQLLLMKETIKELIKKAAHKRIE